MPRRRAGFGQVRRQDAGAAQVAATPSREDLSRICGMAAVAALFSRGPERIERLFFTEAMRGPADRLCRHLAQARKPYRQVDAAELARIAGTPMHGGIVAIARPRPVLPFDAGEARGWASRVPLLLVLDGVGNPHNLGAIVRTAAFFGLDRLVISDHPAQAGPSDAAYRVAEGGLEHVQLYRATRLPAALRRLSGAYRVVATALGRGRSLETMPRDRPVALVLGNEEAGLRRETIASCDEIATIPGAGLIQSLNVSATAAILIHALARNAAAGRDMMPGAGRAAG
ncbi:MAG TPA: RNA methyltransferase [Alphaproteobacteria bacterium]